MGITKGDIRVALPHQKRTSGRRKSGRIGRSSGKVAEASRFFFGKNDKGALSNRIWWPIFNPSGAAIGAAPPPHRDQAMKIKCTQCRKAFCSEMKFQAHACAAIPADASLEELMALYEAQRKGK